MNKRAYKKDAIKAAKDLGYSKEFVEKIKNTENIDKIATLMYVEAKNIGGKDQWE